MKYFSGKKNLFRFGEISRELRSRRPGLGALEKKGQMSKSAHKNYKTAKCLKNGTESVKRAHFSTYRVAQVSRRRTSWGSRGTALPPPPLARFFQNWSSILTLEQWVLCAPCMNMRKLTIHFHLAGIALLKTVLCH